MIELVKKNTNNIEVDSKQKNIQLKKPSVIIDTELSTLSPNPVQNKVITEKINEIEEAMPVIDSRLSLNSTNAVQNKIVASTMSNLSERIDTKLGTDNQILYFTSKNDFINYPFEVGVLYNVDVPVSFDVIKSDSFYCIKETSGKIRLFSKTNNRKYVYEPWSGQRIWLCDSFFKSESEFFEGDNNLDNALNKLGDSLLGIDVALDNIISIQESYIGGNG